MLREGGRSTATAPADDTIRRLRHALLSFYDAAARPLPWRGTRDPYAVWVSEVMSQQTRVETVIPYYERWLRRFPDVDTLAGADIDAVLKHWEGLGYYSRARNLHAAANVVRERHAGTVPSTWEELRALPGIGDYTAGAIASIAWGRARPAVDGNVRRVLSRIFDLPQPSPRALHTIAAALVPADRPGDFNQSLMELGATICTPRAPRCTRCPLADDCAASAAGTQLQRPLPQRAKPIPTFDIVTAVLHDSRGRMLLLRRTGGLLRGLWCFPGEDAMGDPAAVALRIARRHAAPLHDPVPLATVEHTFSHRRERYDCWRIAVRDPIDAEDTVWMDDDAEHALPRAQQRIRALARAALDPPG
jgi:A/G-specific adenine glycosylase